jgi:hypothetical protein
MRSSGESCAVISVIAAMPDEVTTPPAAPSSSASASASTSRVGLPERV